MTTNLPIFLTRTRHGPMFGLATDPYVGRALALLGEFSGTEIRLLDDLLSPGDFVVEAGAHTGSHTIPMAQRVGQSGKVIAFEPQRALYRILRANIAINDLANIADARMQAVDEVERCLDAPIFDYWHEDNFGGFPDTLVAFTESPNKIVGSEAISTITIDALGLPKCSLIKADVEGMEVSVLGGALETIQRHRPLFYLEISARTARALLTSLDAMDYQSWHHCPPLFSEDNYKGARVDPWNGTISTNVLALPRERKMDGRILSRHNLELISDPLRYHAQFSHATPSGACLPFRRDRTA